MNLGYAILLLFIKDGVVIDNVVGPATSRADCIAHISSGFKKNAEQVKGLAEKGISEKVWCIDLSKTSDFDSDSLKPKQKTAPEKGFKDDLTITPPPKYETKL